DGRTLMAANFGNAADLCMFPPTNNSTFPNAPSTYNYSFTVTNVGTATAYNVRLEGESKDNWISLFYDKCIRSHRDKDGWNDSGKRSFLVGGYYEWLAQYPGGSPADYQQQ